MYAVWVGAGLASVQAPIQRGLTKPVLSIAFSMHTDHISNSVILINDDVSVCVHA